MSTVHEIRREERTVEQSADRTTLETPFVSVIVPVYNDPEGLRDTLDTLVGQTYDHERYEVLVVDNRSLDDTRAVAADYANSHDNVHALDERRRQSSYAARVRGIRRARGDVLAFIDADMTVDTDWLEQAIERMEADELDYMACNVQLYADGEETFASRFNRVNGFPIEKYVDELHFAPTCCLLVRSSVVEEVGPFDVRFVSSGDREFGQRVHEAGFEMGYAADVSMYHPTRTSVKSLLKKAIRIGRGKHQMRELYPERYGHPLALVFYPGLYTPSPPSNVRSSVEEWEDLDRTEKARFVALSNGLKLARAYGTVREAVERTVSRE
ncbi:glycosyltransferase [Halomarina oriensis]|uniref:Glycosyltransferase n=1 Tax=Halomarina oriensis TaxID=671145 RepID=A0A6B0GM31_9EURY|nr:glycosyltransferase [Halomarina oriensis]MWG33195.1 glycosyltransferase [Halomarina oriensis]